MTPFHIIGQPGSGKTTLIMDIIKEMGKTLKKPQVKTVKKVYTKPKNRYK